MTSFFVCQRFGPSDQDYYYKKSDEPQPDSPRDPEVNTSFTDNGNNIQFEMFFRIAVQKIVHELVLNSALICCTSMKAPVTLLA